MIYSTSRTCLQHIYGPLTSIFSYSPSAFPFSAFSIRPSRSSHGLCPERQRKTVVWFRPGWDLGGVREDRPVQLPTDGLVSIKRVLHVACVSFVFLSERVALPWDRYWCDIILLYPYIFIIIIPTTQFYCLIIATSCPLYFYFVLSKVCTHSDWYRRESGSLLLRMYAKEVNNLDYTTTAVSSSYIYHIYIFIHILCWKHLVLFALLLEVPYYPPQQQRLALAVFGVQPSPCHNNSRLLIVLLLLLYVHC